MQRANVLETKRVWNNVLVRSSERAYLLHSGTALSGAHLSTGETRLTGVECPKCAIFVHYQAEVFRVARGGEYTCWVKGREEKMDATVNEMVKLPTPLNCSNLAMSLGAARLRIRDLKISDNAKEPDDYKELSTLLSEGAFAIEKETAGASHRELQLKLQIDQELAHETLEDFIKETDLDLNMIGVGGLGSFTWLSVLTVLLLSFLTYFSCKMYMAGAATRYGAGGAVNSSE